MTRRVNRRTGGPALPPSRPPGRPGARRFSLRGISPEQSGSITWPSVSPTWVLYLALLVFSISAVNAVAFWSGGGSGEAVTVLEVPEPVLVEPATPTADLYPGGSALITVVARNPNPFPVRIGSIHLGEGPGGSFAADPAHAGCDVSHLNFTTQDNKGKGWKVPGRSNGVDGTLTISLPAAMQMDLAAANACQGATFTISLEGRP